MRVLSSTSGSGCSGSSSAYRRSAIGVIRRICARWRSSASPDTFATTSSHPRARNARTSAGAPEHAFREPAKLQPALGADAHLVEQRCDTPPPLRRRVAEQRGEIEEQLFRSEIVVKVRAFRQIPDAPLHSDVADRAPKNFR